ncbi:hypothetical protein CVT24_002360 [Panaeolus cyanescens]|uniref:Uncharacterized protein n=1 Tax=Panaeolus cyanescens TaxID=181874 RepID=A0A409XBG6_9AGAR|nr:hypothetical protein CVT24_002360 [Panaeolus cyanescens]
MTELCIHLAGVNIETSVFFEDGGAVSLACHEFEDSDVEMDGPPDCGCGENQLSHYEIDGSVRADLPERCLWHVDGPIGVPTTQPMPHKQSTTASHPKPGRSWESVTTEDDIEDANNSMDIENERRDLPPGNQQSTVSAAKPSLDRRVKSWNRMVEAANVSGKKANHARTNKVTKNCRVFLKVLGNSNQINIRVAGRH